MKIGTVSPNFCFLRVGELSSKARETVSLDFPEAAVQVVKLPGGRKGTYLVSAGVLFKSFICIIMWMGVWYPWRPEEGIASPEVDVAAVASHPVGAGSQTCVLWKSSWDSQLLSRLSLQH